MTQIECSTWRVSPSSVMQSQFIIGKVSVCVVEYLCCWYDAIPKCIDICCGSQVAIRTWWQSVAIDGLIWLQRQKCSHKMCMHLICVSNIIRTDSQWLITMIHSLELKELRLHSTELSTSLDFDEASVIAGQCVGVEAIQERANLHAGGVIS